MSQAPSSCLLLKTDARESLLRYLRVSSLSRYPMVATLFPTMICTGLNRGY